MSGYKTQSFCRRLGFLFLDTNGFQEVFLDAANSGLVWETSLTYMDPKYSVCSINRTFA
jgi:hypothetical protein